MRIQRFSGLVAGLVLAGLLSLGVNCQPRDGFRFLIPLWTMISQVGDVPILVQIPADADAGTLAVLANGSPVTLGSVVVNGLRISATVPLPTPGSFSLEAQIDTLGGTISAFGDLEIVDLQNVDECELMNDVACLLPYPSSRFEVPAATPTGVQLSLPQVGMPVLTGDPLLPDPWNALDGYSPGVQILMHFPAGVDLALSDAPVLLDPDCCGQLDQTPYVDVRTQDGRSLDADSPSILIDADTGERILHFLELDARAAGMPSRQVLVMRPGKNLTPGHRYIVALRDLVDGGGTDISPEPAFQALRDGWGLDIPALQARRPVYNDIFERLADNGIARDDLVLAFDFTVRSEASMTSDMLTIRDLVYSYVNSTSIPLTMDAAFNAANHHPDCQTTGERLWRRVRGTFAGPYYLTNQLDNLSVPYLKRDAMGNPIQNPGALATQPVNFDFAIPCSVLDGVTTVRPVLIGHGLFGTGAGMIDSVDAIADRIETLGVGSFDYIAGATDWRGLSQPDLAFIGLNILGIGTHQLNSFPSFVDRFKQGMANTLVLSRMMKNGYLNGFNEFETTPGDPGTGVFPGNSEDMYYFGVSLGGIMGMFLSALTPDIERFNLDVGAINFSILLQRSTQFTAFEDLLADVGLTDPLDTILGLGLLHEQWVSSDPAGYARTVTGLVDPPLPGSIAKKILMTVAWLDKQVSNQASEIAARTLGLSNVEGSLVAGLEEIPDVLAGPAGADQGLVVYDTGSFDVFDLAYDPYIPPLANEIPDAVCDPHARRLTIEASLAQLLEFLQPGGTVKNFCTDDGVCNASAADELPEDVCDPLP